MTVTGPSLTGTRVTVVSSEQPGRMMAGPAIRATHLARELRDRGAAVRVACTGDPGIDLGVPVDVIGSPSASVFRRLARGCDVVLTQPQRVDVAAGLHRGTARVIYDCYVPSYVEYPASVLAGGPPDRRRRMLIDRNQREFATAVECGDGFLVASSRQKDFLIGALGQAGRLRYPPGPHAEAFPRVAVVPFGLSDQRPPEPAEHVLRGTAVPADALIALWTGGVWNWFDPLTVVRGVAAARQVDPRIHLVFLGVGHPSPAFAGQDAAETALGSPEVRAMVAEGSVVFADEWVPFDRRWDYLRDADVGVCAFYDSPETHMSFRTRLLDHLWSGLPTLTTAGGVLSEQMCRAGAARCLPAQDPDAWAAALLELAGDPRSRDEMADAARAMAPTLTWPVVADPLVELVADIQRGDVGPRSAPGVAAVAPYLAVALENRLR